jgi:hypothetical protein
VQTLLADVISRHSDGSVEQLNVGLPASVGADHVEAIPVVESTTDLGRRPAAVGDAIVFAGADGDDLALLLFDAQDAMVHDQ